MNFRELGLSEETVKAVEELGIARPTTVQADVIPSILEGKDIFAIAPGRCGKTCSYVFPLIDIISRRQGQNILIITADSAQSVAVSDRLAVFNKYHEINEGAAQNGKTGEEANVIIASPDLLLDIDHEEKIDFAAVNILVVDDINLIKKKRQLGNLEKILDRLPADKQNIVFTNRRSRETQGILDKILKTPAEIKIDRAKEDEATQTAAENAGKGQSPAGHGRENAAAGHCAPETCAAGKNAEKPAVRTVPQTDPEAVELMGIFHTFGDKTPAFLLVKGELARGE